MQQANNCNHEQTAIYDDEQDIQETYCVSCGKTLDFVRFVSDEWIGLD